MPNEPTPPPPPKEGLPAEARRRGGMDTLFSAAWFDDEKEGSPAPTERRPAAPAKPLVRPGPDPLVVAVAVLAGLGVLGFSCTSVALTAIFAYLWNLPTM